MYMEASRGVILGTGRIGGKPSPCTVDLARFRPRQSDFINFMFTLLLRRSTMYMYMYVYSSFGQIRLQVRHAW